MNRCTVCGSYAINPTMHGRNANVDTNLCDVCYWRKRAEVFEHALNSEKLCCYCVYWYTDCPKECGGDYVCWQFDTARFSKEATGEKSDT